jgi:phosphoglycerate dehydrogenase-like enzyme
MGTFRVGLTRDFLTPSGELTMGDIGLRALESEPGVSAEFFPEYQPEMSAQQIADCDAVISLAPKYSRRTLEIPDLKMSIVARFGVGYDMVDVEALTERDVILTITPDGVRRPVAMGIVSLMLALSHQLFAKDRLVRQGRWTEKLNIRAHGVTGRVVGSIGLGNVGQEVFRLAKPFEMVYLAFDPFGSADAAADLGVRLVDIETSEPRGLSPRWWRVS